MRILKPGRYEITLGDKTREIVLSLGLKSELYKVITSKQLEISKMRPMDLVDGELRMQIADLEAKLDDLKAPEEKDEEQIKSVERDLQLLYGRAAVEMQVKQVELQQSLANQTIDITGSAVAECLALLLTERDAEGKPVTVVTAQDMLWGEEYAEHQDELMELLEAVGEYLGDTLKKIQKIQGHVLGNQKAS